MLCDTGKFPENFWKCMYSAMNEVQCLPLNFASGINQCFSR